MSTNLTIRQLDGSDQDTYFSLRLHALEKHPQAFATTAEEWRAAAPEKIHALLLASERNIDPILGAFASDSELVGSVGLNFETRLAVGHKASLVALYVASARRRQGIGSQLVTETLQLARQLPGLMFIRLVVDSETSDAVALFEKSGFLVYGREPQARRVQEHYYDQSYMLCFLHDRIA